MAGLGLQNAVNSYMRGKEWAQQQDEIARQQQQRAQLDAANQAAAGVIQASQQEWAANGAQGQYRPNDMTMFKAAEARGMALAKAGMWDKFLENDAQVAPMRIKARAGALQQYEADGDIEKLARTVYPTLFDGKEIVGSKKIDGADGSVNLGLMPIASKIELELSDGTKRVMEPEQLVKMVKGSLIDPVASAKKEVELNFLRTKELIEGAGRERLERVKGEEARKTEGVKGEVQGKRDRAKFGYDLGLAEVNNAAAQKRTDTTAAASRYSADKGYSGRVEAATIGANAKEGGDGGGKKDARFEQLHKQISNIYGRSEMGMFGKTNNPTEDTRKMASYAAALMDADKGMSMPQAIDKAVEEWKKRNPGFKPPRTDGADGLSSVGK